MRRTKISLAVEHAILSASGAKKWLACPPSARLEETLPDDASAEANEGTKAHELMELAARYVYFKEVRDDLRTPEQRAAAGFNEEMKEAVEIFMAECRKITDPLDAAGTPYTVLIEQKLDYSPWAPEGFGTGDFVVVARHCVWVRDFKYGKGVPVETEENSQMMLYGLGAYNELSFAYEDIRELDIGIVQPRIDNVSTWRVSLANLLAWGESVKPIAQLAWEGKGQFNPGEHCTTGFCRARHTCRARILHLLSAAVSPCVTTDEIATLLPVLPQLVSWGNSLQEQALKLAVDDGVTFRGYKLVEGRSNRFISDPKLAAVRLVASGVPQEKIFTAPEPQLLDITALENLTGKKKFQELLNDLLVKPPGKPTLVPDTDKRSVWVAKSSAEDDFAD